MIIVMGYRSQKIKKVISRKAELVIVLTQATECGLQRIV